MLGGGLRREEAARLYPSNLSPAMAPVTDDNDTPLEGVSVSVGQDDPRCPTAVRIRVLGKGDKERICYIAGANAERILSWAVRRPLDAPLFGLVAGAGVWKALDRLRRRAGVAPFTPHDLRRTYASQSLDAGIDLVTVQVAMGHADPRTTSRYDRRGERALEAAARKLASQRLTAQGESC